MVVASVPLLLVSIIFLKHVSLVINIYCVRKKFISTVYEIISCVVKGLCGCVVKGLCGVRGGVCRFEFSIKSAFLCEGEG